MPFIARTAFDGALLVDATKAKELIFKLQPGTLGHLQRTKEGLQGVRDELESALPKYGAKLGIAADVLLRIAEYSDNITQLEPLYTEALKLVRALEESIAYYEDAREAEIGIVAEAVKRRTRKDPLVAERFQKTVKYYGQIAEKAVATRRKNKQAEGAVPMMAKSKVKAKPKPKLEAKTTAEEGSGADKPG